MMMMPLEKNGSWSFHLAGVIAEFPSRALGVETVIAAPAHYIAADGSINENSAPVRKPKTGEHDCSTPEDALAVTRSMATRWSDEDIAATLNRMRLPTGQGKTWTAHRVGSIRRVRGIHAYRSAEKDRTWLTMREAAQHSGVTSHRIRRLIEANILPAEQVVPGAPYQILASDLQNERVIRAMGRKGRPCHLDAGNQIPMFTDA
ncbi:MAG: serine recombinase [Rhodospirillales bacterium]|nr:serine recombinase [Rhodospirillales bacterium]